MLPKIAAFEMSVEEMRIVVWALGYAVVMLALAAYGFHRYHMLYLYFKHKHRKPEPHSRFETLPRVTVQLPVYNEIHVVERLLDAVAALDYPRELLDVQVLDDSNDETRETIARKVAELRGQGLAIAHIVRDNRAGFKAGALENGLAQATGELVLILDADFLPQPDILRRSVDFFTDPKIGMVQTRWGHINREYSWLTRIQSMFLDGHLLIEQTARSRSGKFFNFNGTAGIWRKVCIEDAGGWQHDTLTEDLDLSYRAQLKGWKFVFLNDVVTPAELPVEMNGFKSQQHRWTKGSIQTCLKLLPKVWESNLPLPVKIEASVHLTSNFVYLLLLILCFLVWPIGGFEVSHMKSLLLNIPIFVLATVSAVVFYLVSLRELYPATWKRDALLTPLLLAVGIGLSLNNARAVIEALMGHQSEFTRTPKFGISSRKQSWRSGRYLPTKSLVVLAELLLAGLFAYFMALAYRYEQFLSLPFLALFMAGFLAVAVSSLLQIFTLPGWLAGKPARVWVRDGASEGDVR